MATYVPIRPEGQVQAVRVTQELVSAPGTWPAWLTAAWNIPPDRDNAVYRASNGASGTYILFNGENGIVRITLGDWLVWTGSKGFVLSDEAFTARFEVQ